MSIEVKSNVRNIEEWKESVEHSLIKSLEFMIRVFAQALVIFGRICVLKWEGVFMKFKVMASRRISIFEPISMKDSNSKNRLIRWPNSFGLTERIIAIWLSARHIDKS